MTPTDTGRHTRNPLFLVRFAVAVAVGIALVFGPVAASARADDEMAIDPELDQGLLGEGRQAYRERRDPARALDAYRIFKQNLAAHPDDPTAAWHLSMTCAYIGMRVEHDKKRREAIHQEGLQIANRAVEIDPDCGPCHLLSAVNHALWADQVGIFRVIVGLPTVQGHLARADQLDPTFGGAAALRIQATIADRLPRMFGGGRDKARDLIQKAIGLAPQEPLNYELLVNLLMKQYNDRDRALSVARRALAIPDPGPEYVESQDSLAYMKRFVDFHSTLVSRSGR